MVPAVDLLMGLYCPSNERIPSRRVITPSVRGRE